MKLFKDEGGQVYGFELDGSQDHLIKTGMVRLSEEAEEAIKNPPVAPKELERQKKLEGVEFEGVMCSATKEDRNGLLAVQEHLEAGQSIVFEFENGSELLLTPENAAAFKAVWAPFRASFFKNA